MALLVAAIVAMALAVAALPQQAHAVTTTKGAKVVTLKANKTYRYDVTGDKKADTVRIEFKDQGLTIKINGKVAYREKSVSGSSEEFKAELITLKNRKSFLYYNRGGELYDDEVMLQFRSGKMKLIIDCDKIMPRKLASAASFYPEKVSGNTIKFHFYAMYFSTSSTTSTLEYAYKGGTLKRVNKYSSVDVGSRGDNTYKALKSMKAYTSAKCTKGKFTIRKGQSVTFKKIYVSSKLVSYQVKVGNKTGWIKAQTSGQYVKNGAVFEGLIAGN